MRSLPRTAWWLAILVALSVPGCTPYQKSPGNGAPKRFGVYRGRFEDADGNSRRFRVLLVAGSPDRLHAEVLGPVGGPVLILDGGGGRLSVALPREGTAWAGPVRPETMETILGIRIGLGDLVDAISGGNPAVEGVEIRRAPASGGGLPSLLALSSQGRRLVLERRGRKRIRGAAEVLGTGSPPPGMEVRPLEELGREGEAAGILEREIPPQ